MRRSFLRLFAALSLASFGAAACSDTPTSGGNGTQNGPDAQIGFAVNVAGMAVNLLVVEVTAPDITTPLAFNVPVVNGTATGNLSVPPGAARTIAVRAYDAQGVMTHEGSATVDVRPGQNVNVPITLVPRAGHVPISITIGSIVVSITRASTPPAGGDLVGDTVRLVGSVTFPNGSPVPGARVSWATLNPGIAMVDSVGLVTGRTQGNTQIVATYGGYGAGAGVSFVLADGTDGTDDRTAPRLISFTVSPDTADMADVNTVNVTFAATAEDAAFYSVYVRLRSPDGQQDKECYYSNNPLPGRSTRSCAITLSRYGQAGRWSIVEFAYGDARGNGRSMTTEMLAAEGYDNGVTVTNTGVDYTPPVLHGARFAQDTLYAGSGYSQVTLRITAGDGPSGVEKVEVGGASDDGTFMFGGPGGGGGAVLQWGDEWESYLWVDSQYPPAGTVRLNWVRITDRAGNVTELNEQELDARGMRASFTIVR